MKPEQAKEGQRIAAYDYHRTVGTIAHYANGLVGMKENNNVYHIKQCRLLKKKKRREWTGTWKKAKDTNPENKVFVPYCVDVASGTEMTLLEIK